LEIHSQTKIIYYLKNLKIGHGFFLDCFYKFYNLRLYNIIIIQNWNICTFCWAVFVIGRLNYRFDTFETCVSGILVLLCNSYMEKIVKIKAR